MSYMLPPDVGEWVDMFLSTGEFKDARDVLRQALGVLQQKTDLEAIRAGLADYEAGRCRPFEEYDAEIRAEFGFRQRSGSEP